MLTRVIARYGRIDLLCLDELGYIELDRRGAELLFQVFTEREEKSSVAIASNAAFSEWTSAFTDPRLCAAIVDRLTYDAHIITTGTGSYRLRATAARHQARRHLKKKGPLAMSLINYPGSDHQMAVIGIDAGHARDIMLMLTDAHALISDLAGGAAPAAARQAAAVLRDADSEYTLDSLAGALAETVNWLARANGDALAHIPGD